MSMSSEFFRNTRNFQINGSSFAHVQGDQLSYSTTIVQAKGKEVTEYDEFYNVKRGGIFKLRDIGCYTFSRRWSVGTRERWEEGYRAHRSICTARVTEQPGMVFTVVQYSGPGARKAFDDDFRGLSRVLTSNVSQIYGYNNSDIPSLILYNELVPVAHLEGDMGLLSRMYLYNLRWQLGCGSDRELWMDLGRGLICRGPPGPRPLKLHHWGDFGFVDLPSTATILQDDVLLRFLASCKSKEVDRAVIVGVSHSGSDLWVDDPPQQEAQPTVISMSTSTPIAVTNNDWKCSYNSLPGRKLLDNGLTRFTLTDASYLLLHYNWYANETWLLRAWNFFHARGNNLEDDLSVYNLVYHHASLSGDLSCSKVQRERRLRQPIYLFVRPLPPDLHGHHHTSSVHHWTFDEDGKVPLPHSICHDLGLPIQLELYSDGCSRYWSKDDYKLLYRYQLLRGFDPTMPDFARHLGYDQPSFQLVNDSDRFQHVSRRQFESVSSSLRLAWQAVSIILRQLFFWYG
ncbi:hypothetical protein PQX77_007919 [Marasmius sp. AFHP31]|nr:hypothetical protein PQX77_007919 [Marasmius sp. AFHP31]